MKIHAPAFARRAWRWAMALALAAASVVGCVELKKFAAPEPPAVTTEWRELLDELRSFERRIGFRATKNFASFSTDRKSYPFCGQSSNRLLPYSYEDPAIRWLDSVSEAKCLDVGTDTDVHFGEVEAWGEIGTPVTAAMLASTLDRFVYLIIHEDCHDQFELPYGIEEPLCDIITHRAMAAFSSEKFRWYAIENRAIKHYARTGSRHVRTTIDYYDELEALYRRYARGEMTHEVLLSRRAQVFARAEPALELPQGELNNISLANYMTYSRHYPTLERVVDRLGPEIESVMEFFRHVDRRKPSAETIMTRYQIKEQNSVAFVRAYEAALIETIDHVWAQRSSFPSSG